MRLIGFLAAALLTVLPASAGASVSLPLWPHGAPDAMAMAGPEGPVTSPDDRIVAGRPITHLANVSSPSLTLYQPRGAASGAAVLVFPGGSYKTLVVDLGGVEACNWLNAIGVACILVKYRVPDTGPYPKSKAALEDGERALRLVRAHAAEWHIDAKRIGVLGFSAGAHLSVALGTLFAKPLYDPVDAADNLSARPDFMMIIYPGWLRAGADGVAENPDLPVTAQTPVSFIVQAENDPVHVENSVAFFLALKQAGVAAEMHLYAEGGHGFGLRPTALPVTHWPKLAETWLHTIHVLP
jgi:acetyl esterase/lipase